MLGNGWAKAQGILFGVFLGFYSITPFAGGKPVPDVSFGFASHGTEDVAFYPQNLWVLQSGRISRLDADNTDFLELRELMNADAAANDAATGNLWYADNTGINGVDLDGHLLLGAPIALPNGEKVAGLGADGERGLLWAVTDSGVHQYAVTGEHLASIPLAGKKSEPALTWSTGEVWVFADQQLVRISTSGAVLAAATAPVKQPRLLKVTLDGNGFWLVGRDEVVGVRSDGSVAAGAWPHRLPEPKYVAGDGKGGVWLADKQRLVYLNADGNVSVQADLLKDGLITRNGDALTLIAADIRDGGVWLGSNHAVHRITTTGEHVATVEIDKRGGATQAGVLHIDNTPPEIWINAPAVGTYTNNTTPDIAATYRDFGSRVVPESLRFALNSEELGVTCEKTDADRDCQPAAPLHDGEHSLSATIEDLAGIVGEADPVTFTIDTIPPEITVESPSEGLITNQLEVPFAGFLNEWADMTLDNLALAIDANYTFATTLDLLVEGESSFSLKATDRAGNTSSRTMIVTRDTIPPAPVSVDAVTVEFLADGNIRISGAAGSAEPNSIVHITNPITGETVTVVANADGSFEAVISADGVDSTLTLHLSDAAGNSSSSRQITVRSDSPAAEAMQEGDFGYTYRSLIPVDATIESYNAERFSLLTGKVVELNGTPIDGARVSVLNHSEYGSVTTGSDGTFTLPVDGGGDFVVNYSKNGYTFVQRLVSTGWNRIHVLEEVALLPQDAVATTLTFDGNPDTRILHRSSSYTDIEGSRATTLVFRGDTQVTIHDKSGSETALEGPITVRATEFVAPRTMPGKLPPASAFTFASDLTIDGVSPFDEVRFSQPVVMYVENFLEFPVGERVPLGYYDRNKANWVASDDGRVIRLVDNDGDGVVDGVDGIGDGIADDLNGDGNTTDEIAGIAGNSDYQPGATYWRVEIGHFTPWDANWPFDFPDDAEDPPFEPLAQDQPEECELSSAVGSSVSCESRVFSDTIPLVGSGMELQYLSRRMEGYDIQIRVLATGAEIPASLKDVTVRVEIAGQVFEESVEAEPRRTLVFNWDRKDFLGNLVFGSTQAHVTVTYHYPLVYTAAAGSANARSFGKSGSTVIGYRGSASARVAREYDIAIDSDLQISGAVAPGWSLSSVHAFDKKGMLLKKGDGTTTKIHPLGRLESPTKPAGGYRVRNVDVDASGRVIWSTPRQILTVGVNGYPKSVVGRLGSASEPEKNEGEIATSAALRNIGGFDFASDGTLYFWEDGNARRRGFVRRVNGEGRLENVAFFPDHWNGGIAIGKDGNIFVVANVGSSWRGVRYQLWRLATDGERDLLIDYMPEVRSINMHESSIFITFSSGEIRELKSDGSSESFQVEGVPHDVTWDSTGTMYIAALDFRYASGTTGGIYRRTADGQIVLVSARRPSGSNRIVSGSSLFSTFMAATSIKYSDILGGLLIAPYWTPDNTVDDRQVWISRSKSKTPDLEESEYLVDDTDAGVGYVFSQDGRHLRTIDLISKRPILRIEYDDGMQLAAVADEFGNTLTIERTDNGDVTAIVGSYGKRNELTKDASGYLESVRYPDGSKYRFNYDEGGLLTGKTTPANTSYKYNYDHTGRVESTIDPTGGEHGFSVTQGPDGELDSIVTDPEGRIQRSIRTINAEGNLKWNRVGHDGTPSTVITESNGVSVQETFSDGTSMLSTRSYDPALAVPYVESISLTTPAGLRHTLSMFPDTADMDNDGYWDMRKETVTINGNSIVTSNDIRSGSRTTTTAAGRVLVESYDPANLKLRSRQMTGVAQQKFMWDDHGRLASLQLGGDDEVRLTRFNYYTVGPSKGRLQTVSDPLGRQQHFEYDLKGRTTRHVLPDGREVGYEYDANDNVTAVTPPGRPAHRFTHNTVDLGQDYIPPNLGEVDAATRYIWNRAKQLESVVRPDGLVIDYVYGQSTGKLDRIDVPSGAYIFDYEIETGQLKTLTAPDGTALSYAYDGFLLTAATLTGAVNGEIRYDYDNNFELKGIDFNGQRVAFDYDDDGLLTQAGVLGLSRDVNNGLLQETSLGVVNTDPEYNEFGELGSEVVTINGADVYTVDYERDKVGRIARKVEAINGHIVTHDYSYDPAGRLYVVKQNGMVVADYDYDANGNRTHVNGVLVATYDVQDRLLSYNECDYTYTSNGELDVRTCGSKTLDVDYDVFGNLSHVKLPDGDVIEYVIDGQNRRVGKKINGEAVQAFLYQDQLEPVAELDGSGSVVARFVYGDKSNVPSYMLKNGNTYRIISDHLGSPRLLIDVASGDVVQRMNYDVWGNVLLDSNPGFQPFGFAGGIYDRDTGLVRFGARDYDPKTGRWTSKDPIRFKGGLNHYVYVENTPNLYADPTGLGPMAFLACTAANAAFSVYSFNKTMKEFDSTSMLQDQLQRVNAEIASCPTGDIRRLQGLMEIRNDLTGALTENLGNTAANNNMLGVGDVATAAAIEGFCGLLFFLPVP